MKTYWLSFRLKENATYTERLDALNQVVIEVADGGPHWSETTSFHLFSSSLDTDSVALHVKTAINEKTDLVVIGATEFKTGRIIGNLQDDDILELVPYIKKY